MCSLLKVKRLKMSNIVSVSLIKILYVCGNEA
jgi:hypothetical protein